MSQMLLKNLLKKVTKIDKLNCSNKTCKHCLKPYISQYLKAIGFFPVASKSFELDRNSLNRLNYFLNWQTAD